MFLLYLYNQNKQKHKNYHDNYLMTKNSSTNQLLFCPSEQGNHGTGVQCRATYFPAMFVCKTLMLGECSESINQLFVLSWQCRRYKLNALSNPRPTLHPFRPLGLPQYNYGVVLLTLAFTEQEISSKQARREHLGSF